MSKDVSIVFRASAEGFISNLNSMKQNVKGLSKDVSEFKKLKEDIFEKKSELKLDIKQAKTALKELEKDTKVWTDESIAAYKKQSIELDLMQQDYKDLGKIAREAANEELKFRSEYSKTSNLVQGRENLSNDIKSTINNTSMGLAQGLAQAGLGRMIGQSVQNFANNFITSSLGASSGGIISGLIGSTISGASMGSLAGPVGTAIGAGAGLIVGAIDGLGAKLKEKDDIFRSEVQGIYSQIQQTNSKVLEDGKTTATKLEQDMISFSTLLGGKENANRFLEDIRKFASVTPFEAEGLLSTSKTLLSYGYKQDEILKNMTKIGDAGSALGMDIGSMNFVATSLGRMRSSGKTSLEYLNPLIERGIPAIQYLAESLGKTTEEVYDLISKGKLDGAQSSTVILNAMGEKYQGNMALQAQTMVGMQSALEDTIKEINRFQGEGYNEVRKLGLQKEIDAYDGKLGTNMKEAYKLIGMFEADLENKHQESLINAIKRVQETDEYKLALSENDMVKIGGMYSKARAEAEAQYKNSDLYQMKLKNEINLVNDIQDAIVSNGTYIDFGMAMANEFTKGWNSVVSKVIKDPFSESVQSKIDENYNAQTGLANDEYAAFLKEMGINDSIPTITSSIIGALVNISNKQEKAANNNFNNKYNFNITATNKDEIIKEVVEKLTNALEDSGEGEY